MSVRFTQLLVDEGARRATDIELSPNIEAMAREFISEGGEYESAVLKDEEGGDLVRLAALFKYPDGTRAIIAHIYHPNDPGIPDRAADLINKSYEWLSGYREGRAEAERARLPGGIVVEYNGRRGVSVSHFDNDVHLADETPVVFEGLVSPLVVETKCLTRLAPENAVADLFKCGGGEGERCCIFLTVGPMGPQCARRGSLRATLLAKRMRAKRRPVKIFPACQDLNDGAPE
jgi:hypothetical protein